MLEMCDNNKINPLENIGAITLFNSCNTRNFFNLANEKQFSTMRLFFASVLCLVSGFTAFSQRPALYDAHIRKAEAFLAAKEYPAAAREYSAAFESLGWKGYQEDRYNAARAWAMSGVPDSAFINLFRITEKLKFDNLDAVTSEPDFGSLHPDARWTDLCAKIRANQPSMPELRKTLQAIRYDDQRYRLMTDSVEGRYGNASVEMDLLRKNMIETDSVNLLKVKAILDQYGWLGPAEVGPDGNSALFLVIQHADLPVQEKYLPLMREAAGNGKARRTDLALLEDRVNMRNGKKQIYGSQIKRDPNSGAYYIYPIEDPKNVDKRRAEAGLGPLADYVSIWGFKWNEEEAEKMEKQLIEPHK